MGSGSRAEAATMRFGGRYVLGIDALPRGNYAAVVVGRTIDDTFAVESQGHSILPLEHRVRQAVGEAETRRGAAPSEVRLVCIDDGADGAELERIGSWLDEAVGARLQVFDLMGPAKATSAEQPDEADGLVRSSALSAARACEAALW